MINGVPEIYTKLGNWQDKHELNAKATSNCISVFEEQYANGEITEEKLLQNESALIDIYNEKTAEIGYTFNFMEGENPENKESYQAQLEKLATGEMMTKDSDNDGQISRSEYIMGEIYNSATKMTPEEKAQTALNASMAFDAINALVLVDSNPENDELDNSLSEEDMQNFYKALDGYNFNDETGDVAFDGNFDGELDVESFGAFMTTATAGVSQKDQDNLYNKFLEVFSEKKE